MRGLMGLGLAALLVVLLFASPEARGVTTDILGHILGTLWEIVSGALREAASQR